jgi:3-deoxy-D-manno-octulosonate 8-phosphate phosphatase (KDO 8-P phosphatase)
MRPEAEYCNPRGPVMMPAMSDIRCLCLDVDGVLTDGRLYVDDDGRTTRAFHIHDGLALRAFQQLGGVVVICTGKRSGAVAARARELEIEHVIQGSADKLADLQAWLDQHGLRLEQVAAVGDDLPDLPVLQRCGLPIAVANAVDEVKAAARYVTQRAGGDGAVREAVEYILRSSGRWNEVLAQFGVCIAVPEAAP